MAVTVKFLSAFQDLTQSKKIFFVEREKLDQIIDELDMQVPGLKQKLIHPMERSILPIKSSTSKVISRNCARN